MNSFGTRTFWKPLPGNPTATAAQILKLSGYINIVLHAVHYRSVGTFWQKLLGGSDKITLTSQVTYQNSENSIAAAMVQDIRTVKANKETHLGIRRNLALKVPAAADGLELRIQLVAIHDDKFETILSLLNTDEFRKPLELAAPVVGQIVTISSLIKKATTTKATSKLETSYPGIISQAASSNPLDSGELLKGYLILLSANDDAVENLDEIEAAKLQVVDGALRYNGKAVKSTYAVCSISLDEVRGLDIKAAWYRKFQEAERKLEDLRTVSESKRKKIYEESLALWGQGCALLDDDNTYIPAERKQIKEERFQFIFDLYSTLVGGAQHFGGSGNQRVVRFLPPALADLVEFRNESFPELRSNVLAYSNALKRCGLSLNWKQ